MVLNSIKISITLVILILGVILLRQVFSLEKKIEELIKEKQCLTEVFQINEYYFKKNVSVNVRVIKETILAIDKYLPKYFPEGPFNRYDLIALAMTESNFYQYCIGTSGEKGIFQIMPESCRNFGAYKNEFDIEVNTQMALFILKQKYDHFKDYKKAIIAYNGVVIQKNNTWSEKYWKRFISFRNTLEIILEKK